MKILLINDKSSLCYVLLWLNLLVFLCAIRLYSMPGSVELPSSFPTEPVSQAAGFGLARQMQSSGPDNIAISDEKDGEQGNWVKKKQWLLKSFEVNNNIYNLALQIADTRNIYSTKNDAISDELQTFYKKLGVEQGKLQELFESVERYLEKKKKKDLTAIASDGEKQPDVDRDYQSKVELIETQIKQLKDELDQLKLDMKSIEDIGRSLNQRLEKVDEQIVSAMNFAETAKRKVEDLWEIIDDKKARTIYYDLVNVEENLKVILTYLKDTLSADFDAVLQNAKKQMDVANEDIKKLESKGLIIKDRSAKIEKLKLQELQKTEQEKSLAERTAQTKREPKSTQEKPKNVGLWQQIYDYCVDLYVKIYKHVLGFWKTESSKKSAVQSLANEPKAQPIDQNLTSSSSQATSATSDVTPMDAAPQQQTTQPVAVPSMQLIQ